MTLRPGTIAASLAGSAFLFGILTLWIVDAWPFAVFQAILCLALICVVAGIVQHPGPHSFHPLLSLPLLVAITGGIQLVVPHTENAWETRRAVIEWTTNGVAAFICFDICLRRQARESALRIFALASAAIVLWSVVQEYSSRGLVFWFFDSGYSDQVFGPFLNHSKFSNFAELAFAAALWAGIARPRRRGLYIAAAGVLFASVLASGSRGGAAIITFEAIVLLAWGRSGRVRLAATAAVLVLFTVLILGVNGDAGRDVRWMLDRSSLVMVGSFGVLGSGLGTWSTVYPQFASFDAYARINQAHNDWLQWLIEGGWPVLLIVLAMFGAALRAGFKEWWALGFVFVWLHGLIDYPMQQTPSFAALLVGFWGAAIATLMERPQSRTQIGLG